MKKRTQQLLTVTMLLSTSFIAHATLVNGFSDIQASNPRSSAARMEACNKRIAEEIGNIVTLKPFTNFLNLTQDYIKNIQSKPSRTQLEVVVKAVIDLFVSFKKLDKNDQSDQLQSLLTQVKSNALQLNLPSQLKKLLQDTAQ